MKREVREIASRGEWLSWRKGYITASRIGALFDCHPYLTRDGLAAELRGASQGDNPAMRRGRILEPAVIEALHEEHPDWRMRRATTWHTMPALRLGCTPDVFLNDRELIQIKTVSPDQWEKWHGHPPLAYQLQTLCEMLVTNATGGILAVMVCSPSYPVHEFQIPRHEDAEAKILAAVAQWWRAWDAGEVVEPASAEGLAADLDDGSHKDLSGSNELPGMLDERETLKAEASAMEKRLKAIDAEIKAAIGAARTAYVPGWALSMPVVNVKEHLVAASQYRRLNIKRVEE